MKLCKKCLINKSPAQFHKQTRRYDGLHPWCKLCCLEYNRLNKDSKNLNLKNWRDKNREHCRKQDKIYRDRSKEKKAIYTKIYHKNRRATDPAFKITTNLRNRLRMALKSNSKNCKTFELVGCSPEDLKKYLESKFQPGMTWNNYGSNGWHIDHIIPLSSFNLLDNKELEKAMHYSNLQPLWQFDNLSKGGKCG